MNIAICDDDRFCREEALDAANEYISQNENKAVTVDIFSHAEDLLEAVNKNGGYDIYILDVLMPDTNGIELGKLLRDGGYDGKIIYLTSSEEFAVHSYKVKAFDYLLKPIDKNSFFECLENAVNSVMEKSGKRILVKTKDSTVKLNFESIMYAELNRRSISYYLSNGKKIESTQLRSTFSEATKELVADSRFYPAGASMVINLDYITEIGTDCVTLKDGNQLHFSVKAVREIRSAWCEFCLSEVKGK